MTEKITLGAAKKLLEPLNDQILRGLPGGDETECEVRRSSFRIEGGGAFYLLTLTVMPEGERRAETPRFEGFGEGEG